MEPWQFISLLPPPVQTTIIKGNIDFKCLKHICYNTIRVLSKQSPLHREGALLSRFVYKYDKKFRNDIGYRNIKKTNSTLRKYLQINLLKDVENFMAVLPNEDEDFLPTRQMLEYVLSRIIAFSKLMVRIYTCSKQAAIFYLDRVKRGESHWMSVMPYALLSRIWSICSVLLQHATSWYSNFHSYLTVLQPKGLQFLPQACELPMNLEEYLDLKNLDSFGKLSWSQRKYLNNELIMQDDEDVDLFDNILDYTDHINEELEEAETEKLDTVPAMKQEHSQPVKIDYGEAISRDTYKHMNTKRKQNETITQDNTNISYEQSMTEKSCEVLSKFQKKISSDNKTIHYFGRVSNSKSLQEFLDREETLRNDGNKDSLTQHLSFMQWHMLKNSLSKVCDSVLNNKRIEKKLLKVWKEKCLDYI